VRQITKGKKRDAKRSFHRISQPDPKKKKGGSEKGGGKAVALNPERGKKKKNRMGGRKKKNRVQYCQRRRKKNTVNCHDFHTKQGRKGKKRKRLLTEKTGRQPFLYRRKMVTKGKEEKKKKPMGKTRTKERNPCCIRFR